MLADKRNLSDPTQLGQAILDRPDKTVPAHVEADRILDASNGHKPWEKIPGLKKTVRR